MPTRNLNLVVLTLSLSLACYLKADRNQYAAVVAEAIQKIRIFYLEDADSRSLFEDAMSGMVSGLDQYSRYISPDAFRQMEEELDQEFGGVGIEIEKRDEASPLLVLSPLVGTPAYRAGLRAGDQIIEIEGQSTRGMLRSDSVDLMRGSPGTPVNLKILHPGDEEPVEMTILREIIVVQSVLGDTRRADGSWDYHLTKDARIGYLRLTTFGKHTVEELREVVTAPEYTNLESLLIDLRGNAGGLLTAAVDVCDLFFEEGRIVSTRGRDGTVRNTYDATSQLLIPPQVPVAILVNRYTASASEIVAACLQDHGRAVIIGERTWGKGTVQNLIELEGGRSALKLTTASYWRPSGQDIHRNENEDEDGLWGVRPTEGYLIPLTDEQMAGVLLERRDRDLYEGLERPKTEPTSSAPDEEPPRQEPAEDLQLNAAIEYLKERMRDRAAQDRTA